MLAPVQLVCRGTRHFPETVGDGSLIDLKTVPLHFCFMSYEIIVINMVNEVFL